MLLRFTKSTAALPQSVSSFATRRTFPGFIQPVSAMRDGAFSASISAGCAFARDAASFATCM